MLIVKKSKLFAELRCRAARLLSTFSSDRRPATKPEVPKQEPHVDLGRGMHRVHAHARHGLGTSGFVADRRTEGNVERSRAARQARQHCAQHRHACARLLINYTSTINYIRLPCGDHGKI